MPIREEIMEQTSPRILNTRPAILPVALYSLAPKTIPIIEVMWPTSANNQAITIPIIPKTIDAGELLDV